MSQKILQHGKKYIFSNIYEDWDLDKYKKLLHSHSIDYVQITEDKYFIIPTSLSMLPKLYEKNPRYQIHQHILTIIWHLNIKIDSIDSAINEQEKNKPKINLKYPMEDVFLHMKRIHFLQIELLLFLHIYLDTLVLLVSNKKYESFSNKGFFKEYNINKTEHFSHMLDVISAGSNNIKHQSRCSQLNRLFIESLERPFIPLELSTRNNKNNNEYIEQPLEDLIKGTNVFALRLMLALKEHL